MKKAKLGYEPEDYQKMFDKVIKSMEIQKKIWIYATIITVIGLLTSDAY